MYKYHRMLYSLTKPIKVLWTTKADSQSPSWLPVQRVENILGKCDNILIWIPLDQEDFSTFFKKVKEDPFLSS